jgi:uncharacterized protein YbjT (DUF2867 family)
MGQNLIIAGATGLVGSEVLRLIKVNQQIDRVITVGRRPPDVVAENFQFIPYDFTSALPLADGSLPNLVGICALGTTIRQAGSQEAFRQVDYEYVRKFAVEMRRLGAQSLHVVTAHGASAKSGIFYNRVKGEIEEALKAMNFPRLHIYHPSLLLGDRKEHRVGEGAATFAAKILGPVFKLPGLNAIQPTPATHLAEFILKKVRSDEPGATHSNLEIMRS